MGVPKICPLVVLKVRPGGRVLAGTLQEYGGTPPEACTALLYNVPRVAFGRTVELIASGVVLLIVTVKRSEVTDNGINALSLSPTLKLKVPLVVGVPTIEPVLGLMLRPGGRQVVCGGGQTIEKVYGVTPNSAAICWLYPTPFEPLGKVRVVNCGA